MDAIRDSTAFDTLPGMNISLQLNTSDQKAKNDCSTLVLRLPGVLEIF